MNRRDALQRAPRLSVVDPGEVEAPVSHAPHAHVHGRSSYIAPEERDSRAPRVRPPLVAPSELESYDDQPTRSPRESYVALEELGQLDHAGTHRPLSRVDLAPLEAVLPSGRPASSDSVTSFHVARPSHHGLDNESVTSFHAARPSYVAVCESDADVFGLCPNQWGDPTHPQGSASPTLVQVFAPTAELTQAFGELESADVLAVESQSMAAVYDRGSNNRMSRPAQAGVEPLSAEVEPLDLDALRRYLFDDAPAAEPVHAEPMDTRARVSQPPAALSRRRASSPAIEELGSGGTPINPILPRLAEIQQVIAQRQRMSMLPAHEVGDLPMPSVGPTVRSAMSSFHGRPPPSFPPPASASHAFSAPTPSCPVPSFTPSIAPDSQMPDSGFNAWALPASVRRPSQRPPESFKLTLTAVFVGMTAVITLAVLVLAIAFVTTDNKPDHSTATATSEAVPSSTILITPPPAPPPPVVSSDDVAPQLAPPPRKDAKPAPVATPVPARVEATTPAPVRAKVEKAEKVEKSDKTESPKREKASKPTTTPKEKSVEQMLLELGEEQLKNTLTR
jgi:hypothetical protein